jgi:hypothetical protein
MPPARSLSEWTERYRQFWEESFERLDEYLMQRQREEHDNGLDDE